MAGESFFTHDPNEETRAARAEDDTQLHGTIPADLIPYLEEAKASKARSRSLTSSC